MQTLSDLEKRISQLHAAQDGQRKLLYFMLGLLLVLLLILL